MSKYDDYFRYTNVQSNDVPLVNRQYLTVRTDTWWISEIYHFTRGGGVLLIRIYILYLFWNKNVGERRSPAVACWASDQWVASSNPLTGKFRH